MAINPVPSFVPHPGAEQHGQGQQAEERSKGHVLMSGTTVAMAA
jgi:hypothetical protein